MRYFFQKTGLLLTVMGLSLMGWSQGEEQLTTDELAGQVNTLTSAVPFLTIAPDSRSGAMGDAGIALNPDANSMHWNPSKYAFINEDFGVSLSYTPWLRNIIDDINLSYLSVFKRLDNEQTVAATLRYFSMGNIVFTNIQGTKIRDFNPNEFAIDAAYSRKLGDNISGGVALRYIYSNLTGDAYVGTTESHPGNSVAADLSLYYQSDDIDLGEKKGEFALGMNISNIGAKISYTDDSEKNFIPTNLGLGGALTMHLDDYNSLLVTADLNKLLIPTPPARDGDSIIAGYDSDVSVATGMFQSFYDAPGGIEEELHEINYSVGLEYWYAEQFAVRAGYFHEHATKGNRKFFTTGLGLELNVIGINFSYLIATDQRNPLENTLRFSIYFNLDNLKGEE